MDDDFPGICIGLDRGRKSRAVPAASKLRESDCARFGVRRCCSDVTWLLSAAHAHSSPDRINVKSVEQFLLQLYGSTMDVRPGEYSQWVFGLMQSMISFDSAGRSALDTRSGETLVIGADIYQEDADVLAQWQTVNRDDPVLAYGLSHPLQAVTFHAPTIMASLRDAGMQHYLKHNDQHQNGLVVLAPSAPGGLWDALGVYRARSDQQFSRREMELVQMLMPHVLQAIKINHSLASSSAEPASGPVTAIVRANGQLQYSAPELAALLRLEWPDWRGYVLPAHLINALGASAAGQFKGRHIEATATVSGAVIMLRLKRMSPLASLSDREAQAARLFGAGFSVKEIAQKMGIAPNTVRNFVQRIYKKLNVNDKAALAVLLSADT